MDKAANPRGQTARTKEDIFCVALELFRTVGYEPTTIQDICEKANVSVGAFYYYYKSKEDILVDSYRQMDSMLMERYAQLRFENPLQGLLDVLCCIADYVQRQGFRIPAQIYKNQINAPVRFLLDPNRAACLLVYRLTGQAREDGWLREDLSAQAAGDRLLRFIRGIAYDWCLLDGSYDLVAQVREDVQAILAYFEKKDG